MPQTKHIAAIVLAAGSSRRFAPGMKLLADFRGRPLVRHAVEAATRSRAKPVIVVTGHRADDVERCIIGSGARFIRNPRFAEGMASSLIAGVATLPADIEGAVICLADMPLVKSATIDRLIDAFSHAPENMTAIAPAYEGRRGNPVLLSRALFGEIATLAGDQGARRLLRDETTLTFSTDDAGVVFDVDMIGDLHGD